MSAQMNNEPANNPLVGKTVVVTYETGAPGASFEIDFFSNSQKTSTGRGTAAGYVGTDDYEMAVEGCVLIGLVADSPFALPSVALGRAAEVPR